MADSIEVLDPTVDQSGYTRQPVATQIKSTTHVQLTQLDIGNTTTIVPLVAGQTTKAGSLPVALASDDSAVVALGAPADAAASSDTGTFSLIAFIKRSLQNWTTLLARIPALSGGAVPVTASSLPLPSGAATSGNQATANTSLAQIDTDLGSLTETAPATDTASSGLNGRLQRIAQRLTSLIALLPSALVGGRLDVNIGAAPVTLSTNMVRGTTPTVTTVSSLATSQAMAAANASRLGLSIFNNSNQYLYVRFGAAAATTSDFSVAIQPGGLYEIPDRSVTLAIQGIWAAANGAGQVTEVT